MSEVAAPREPAAERRRRAGGGGGWFGSMTAGWLVFGVLLLASPDTLDRFWSWVRGLPLLAEAGLWLLLLPWLLALAVWESSWDAWLRVLVVVLLAVLWSGVSAPRAEGGDERARRGGRGR